MRDAFIASLLTKARADDTIWLLNADLGFSVLEPFQQEFPDRYINVGIAEQNMAGIAAGLAMSGNKVFIYSIGNFPTFRCLEQLRNDVCYHDADVTVVSVGGGFSYGSQGYTHHAIEDVCIMRSLPGMTIFAPGDPAETRAAMDYFAANKGPGYLRLGRAGEAAIHPHDVTLNQFSAQMVQPGDNQVLLLSTGGVLNETVAAKALLAEKGLNVTVMSLPKLKPIDSQKLLETLSSYQVVLTVEEHSLIGGLRDIVAPVLAMSSCNVKLLSLGVEDGVTKGIIGNQSYMRAFCNVDSDAIVKTVSQLLL